MTEKTTPVDKLSEILSVPELDFIGPSDLSVQLRYPNDKQHADVTEQIEEIRTACRSANVPMGGISTENEAIEQAAEDGYQIVRIGNDLGCIRTVLGDRLQQLDR